MKKLIILLAVAAISIAAQGQPAAVQKAGKSVFTLTTFAADGSIIGTTHGVFTGSNGEAVSSWKPFVGAARAVVIDANGQQHDVQAIYGANELYDVCRFRVEGTSTSVPLAQKNSAAGQKLWLLGYSVKKAPAKQYTVKNVETFMDGYGYYIFDGHTADNTADCPFVNQNGEIVALCQLSKTDSEVHATDVRFANSFETRGLTINEPLLRQTSIRTALPHDLNEARLTLMMAGEKADTAAYDAYVADFIAQFPTAIDGYSSRAQRQLAQLDYAGADATMQQAISSCADKDEAHSAYSSLIYQQQLYHPDTTYGDWSLQKALSQANEAYAIKPLSVYSHQQAQIVFAQGQYDDAYQRFMALTKSDIRNGELFYEATQCQTHLGATPEQIIALLDSAVSVNPDQSISAPYYLARGRLLDQAGQVRRAVQDYNKYDTLTYGRGSHDFYYIKYKAESRIRQYQQALQDIAHAIVLNRTEPTYYAEMASLQLRVNQLEDAIRTADLCIQLEPDYADPYIVKGIAHGELKQKAEALQALGKAKELGDERADALIEKYKK